MQKLCRKQETVPITGSSAFTLALCRTRKNLQSSVKVDTRSQNAIGTERCKTPEVVESVGQICLPCLKHAILAKHAEALYEIAGCLIKTYLLEERLLRSLYLMSRDQSVEKFAHGLK